MSLDRIEMIIKYIDFDLLNDWETNFIISIEEQFHRKGFLTENQRNKLEDIWGKNQE